MSTPREDDVPYAKIPHAAAASSPMRFRMGYDVEVVEGDPETTETLELPFVVGVLADLSGQPEPALPALKDRNFVNIDRDRFDTVLEKAAPRLVLQIPNRVADDGRLAPMKDLDGLRDFSAQFAFPALWMTNRKA